MIKKLSKPAKPSKASVARDNVSKKAMCPNDIYTILKPQLDTLVQEIAWLVCVDSMANVLSIEEIGRGTVDHVEVNARDVFRPAIELAAVGVVLVHNHPSGNAEPSEGDKGLTRRMIAAGHLIGIPLVDHLVISKNGFTSLADKMPEFGWPPELVAARITGGF
jgi:DNA repair protein RadC